MTMMVMLVMTMMIMRWWWPGGCLQTGPKCWAPVLAAAAAVSGRTLGAQCDAKLSTERRERQGLRPHHDGWSPGPRWQGSEKTIQRPWESRVSNYFRSYGKTISYGAIRILVMDRSFYPVIYKMLRYSGDHNIRTWPQHRLATVGHHLTS